MDMDVKSTPLLRIIQDGSPEVKRSHKDFAVKGIPGAEPGDILFLPTSEVYKEIETLVIGQKTVYTEWRPTSAGGGLIGHHPLTIIRDPNYKPRTKDKGEMLGENELVQTMYFLVLFRKAGSDEEWREALISFSKAGLPNARTWAKMILGFRYPDEKQYKGVQTFSFSQSYIVSSQTERNAKGDWYGYAFKAGRILDFKADADLLSRAADFARDAQTYLPQPQQQQNNQLLLSDGEQPY